MTTAKQNPPAADRGAAKDEALQFALSDLIGADVIVMDENPVGASNLGDFKAIVNGRTRSVSASPAQ